MYVSQYSPSPSQLDYSIINVESVTRVHYLQERVKRMVLGLVRAIMEVMTCRKHLQVKRGNSKKPKTNY